MAHFPPGGVALHGTSFQKALLIARDGLLGDSYFCPIPNPNSPLFRLLPGFSRMDEQAYLSRVIGSIFFSGRFSFSERHALESPADPGRPEPALVVFASWDGQYPFFNRPADGSDIPIWASNLAFTLRTYRSFGKSKRAIEPEMACAIVRLPEEERAALEDKARERTAADPILLSMLCAHLSGHALAIKALKLIEQLTSFQSRPAQVLIP